MEADFSIVEVPYGFKVYPETKEANYWLRKQTYTSLIAMSMKLSTEEVCELMARMVEEGFTVNATVRTAA